MAHEPLDNRELHGSPIALLTLSLKVMLISELSWQTMPYCKKIFTYPELDDDYAASTLSHRRRRFA